MLLWIAYAIHKHMRMRLVLNDFLFIWELLFVYFVKGQREGGKSQHCGKCYFIIYLYVENVD